MNVEETTHKALIAIQFMIDKSAENGIVLTVNDIILGIKDGNYSNYFVSLMQA